MADKKPVRKAMIPMERIAQGILLIREQKVMLDADLARIYGVSTKRLNEQVKRNRARFPADFMFALTRRERQEVVANCDHLARLKFSPARSNAFTEHGAIMAAAVLNSPRAVEVSVFVVRAFVQLREFSRTHKDIGRKLDTLERKVAGHDKAIAGLIHAIHELMIPPEPTKKKRPIGFMREDDK
jgi:hypothetical protein